MGLPRSAEAPVSFGQACGPPSDLRYDSPSRQLPGRHGNGLSIPAEITISWSNTTPCKAPKGPCAPTCPWAVLGGEGWEHGRSESSLTDKEARNAGRGSAFPAQVPSAGCPSEYLSRSLDTHSFLRTRAPWAQGGCSSSCRHICISAKRETRAKEVLPIPRKSNAGGIALCLDPVGHNTVACHTRESRKCPL